MADRAETVLKGKNGIWDRWEIGEVLISVGDSITLDNFDSVRTLLSAYVFLKVAGTNLTCTLGVKTITVTGDPGAANVPCFYVAYGYKA